MIRPRKSASSSSCSSALVFARLIGDVLLLHLAEQPLDPALQLAFELGAVDDEDHRRVLEALLVFEDQPRGGEQREGLARALRVPDQAARLGRIGAALDDRVDGAALVLAQHGLPRLAVLDVEQNPVLQRAQEVGALEERLHREAVGLVRRLLPARHVAAGGVPGDAVPVVEQVRDVEELRRADQLRRLDLVAAQLLDRRARWRRRPSGSCARRCRPARR